MDFALQRYANAPSAARSTRRPIAVWLLVCCALVFAMVVVGGVTRLTHSGLSIVEWKPLVGAIPPLNEAQWAETFAKYQRTPEFKLVNHAMTVAEFKGIFWWEYFHRLLGRMIGVVFLLPLLWFVLRRQVGRALALKLGGIFVLGGLQGAMGWYMVQSGLVDDPRVSHFRLTAHLSIAFLILAAMFWLALDLLHPARRAGVPARGPLSGLRRHAGWLTGIAAYMVVTGGLVAGIRAGYAYNTFPLMNGRWIPPEIMMIDPWWKNFFYNMATVQFDHRLGAWALTFLTVLLWWRTRGADLPVPVRRALVALTVALLVQVSLGIGTLLTGVSVPLAAAHQGCAVLLFGAALALNHAFARADQA